MEVEGYLKVPVRVATRVPLRDPSFHDHAEVSKTGHEQTDPEHRLHPKVAEARSP